MGASHNADPLLGPEKIARREVEASQAHPTTLLSSHLGAGQGSRLVGARLLGGLRHAGIARFIRVALSPG